MTDVSEPNLGLASTRELINELQARWEMSHRRADVHYRMPYQLSKLEQMFMRDGSLDYKTVEG